MADTETFDALVDCLVDTANAHHAATGGTNPGWARWYAEHSLDRVSRALGVEWTVDQLEVWLVEADRRYREADQPRSWPKMYATWLLDEFGQTLGGGT